MNVDQNINISLPQPQHAEALNFNDLTKGQIDAKAVSKISKFILYSSENEIKSHLLELGSLKLKLKDTMQSIKKDTTGILAYFRYLFSPTEKAKRLLLLDEIVILNSFIENLAKAKVKSNEPLSESVLPETDNEPKAPPVPPLRTSSKQNPIEQQKTESTTPPPPAPPVPKLNLSTIAGAPPPPPAPGMKGRLPSARGNSLTNSTKVLTEEEKYLASEKTRLERLMNRRANPIETFYTLTPPKDEQRLSAEQANIQRDIGNIERDIQRINKQQSVDAQWLKQKEEQLAAKKKELENTEERLKPQQRAINSRDPAFKEKIAQYKNSELKLLIGLVFDGKEPADTHVNFNNFTQNQDLINSIFGEWGQLKGQYPTFLPHEENWKKYLSLNLFSFIDVLKKRLLATNHREYLEEPKYAVVPFAERKATSRSAPLTSARNTGMSIAEELAQKQAERANQAAQRELTKAQKKVRFVPTE